MMLKQGRNRLAEDWESHAKDIKALRVCVVENAEQKQKRINQLKNNFIDFCNYYFPNYCTAEFAQFHKDFSKKVISENKLYIVRAWAREHGKSIISGLLLPMYLKSIGKLKNMLLVSHSYDNACELLMPILLTLQHNSLYINDYGIQKNFRQWEIGKFVTRDGCSFRAIGAGQSPRGTRNEETRPDFILIDDIDTDEEVRNPKRIQKKWEWIEQALFPTLSISGHKRFVVVGNIIGKDCIIRRAEKVADDFQSINILDKTGQPSWKKRYSLKDCNYMLSKISYASGQKEYFNNPITEGSIFKTMTWDKIPPLKTFKYLICYTDPSWKDHKRADYKATVLLGLHKGVFYIPKAFVEQTTTDQMISWHYDILEYCGSTPVYMYIEANLMQDVLLERFRAAEKSYKKILPLRGDHRKKGDKFSRIESLLEPLNRQHRLILNEKEQKNPHFKKLEEQFISLELGSTSHDDGPDAVEGGIYILNKKQTGQRTFKIGSFVRSKRSVRI